MNHHNEYSPSSWPALIICGKFENDGEESQEAAKGTGIHREVEEFFKSSKMMDEKLSAEAKWAVETVMDMAEKDEKIETEMKVRILEGENFFSFGTIDLLCQGEKLTIFDIKTGQKRNYKPQMAAYALGAMQRSFGFDSVDIVLLYTLEQKTTQYTITVTECIDILEKVKRNKEEKMYAENEYCGWCKEKTSCSAILYEVEKVPEVPSLEKLDLDNPEDFSVAWKVKKIVKKWAAFIEKHKTAEKIKTGEFSAEGVKVIKRKGSVYVSNIQEAFKLSGLSESDFLGCCSVSLAKLEKKVNLMTIEKSLGYGKETSYLK